MLNLVYNVIIGPIKLFFEIVYAIVNRATDNPGLSIVALSLLMNLLVLPLYIRADKMQEEERDKEELMHDDVLHIKSTFKGDERMMILQSYYRHVGYKQTDAVKGSISLFLEIPFFIAAYQFLSHLTLLHGASFGPISDLGKPDGLLYIFGNAVNIMPLIMTGINIISVFIFTKDHTLKTKIQLYAMALFFLVFLYNSPAGLVIYWTLNNLFSLVKTILYKMKNPGRVISVFCVIGGLLFLWYGMFCYDSSSVRRRILIIGLGVICLAGVFILNYMNNKRISFLGLNSRKERKGIIIEGLFLSLLLGCLIPSSIVAASPQEFVFMSDLFNPLVYLAGSVSVATGCFILWFGIFYYISNDTGKTVFEYLIWIFCGISIADYMFFGTDLGTLTAGLKYENDISFSGVSIVINCLIIAIVAFVFFLLKNRFGMLSKGICITGILVLIVMSVLNINDINRSYIELCNKPEDNSVDPHFTLSTTGKNVIVFMLDRAVSVYIPYVFNEKPELKDKFDGFTYYANTVSFGRYTNFGSPVLWGGYEYTPVEMNKRDNERLEDKQNEAVKVMPVIFNDNGYEVTVCDPTYAGYQWISDLSIYDEYPDINTYNTKGLFVDPEIIDNQVADNNRNFFCFSLMKVSPLLLQKTIYNGGLYNKNEVGSSTSQGEISPSRAHGRSAPFMWAYGALCNIMNMTRITDDNKNTFVMMSNDTPHETMLLQEPEYEVKTDVDNTEYDASHKDRFTIGDKSIEMETYTQYAQYDDIMVSMMRVGEWLDHMRELGVYDNTRIILVADHGMFVHSNKEMALDDGTDDLMDTEAYYPMLMMKDFNSKGFEVSEEFMTNGDVPTMAMEGLIEDPHNPFTGKAINNDEKSAHDQYIIASPEHNVTINNGNTFMASKWLSVHDDMRDRNNWKVIAEDAVLKEYFK